MQSHQLKAILFSDVVGFSKRMASDEKSTMAMLARNKSRHLSVIPKHGGQVIDSMGDGYLCVFDSSRQAVDAGLALQQDIASSDDDVELRVGIHVGDTVVERSMGRIKDVFGDCVNIAARIESNAPSPGVWVSARVAADLRNLTHFELTSAGLFNLKNIPEPMELFGVSKLPSEDPSQDVPAVEPKQQPRPRWMLWSLVSIVGLFAVALAGAVSMGYLSEEDHETFALLPIEYIGADADKSYLSRSVQEGLIQQLEQNPDYLLLSKSTANRLFTSAAELKDQELDFYIEGSLSLLTGGELELSLRLVEADTELLKASSIVTGSESSLQTLIDQSVAELMKDPI